MSGNTTTIEQELSLLKGSQVMSALSPKNCAIERSEQLSYFAILSHYVTQLLDYLSACLKKYLPWINDILQSALTIFFASPRCTNIFSNCLPLQLFIFGLSITLLLLFVIVALLNLVETDKKTFILIIEFLGALAETVLFTIAVLGSLALPDDIAPFFSGIHAIVPYLFLVINLLSIISNFFEAYVNWNRAWTAIQYKDEQKALDYQKIALVNLFSAFQSAFFAGILITGMLFTTPAACSILFAIASFIMIWLNRAYKVAYPEKKDDHLARLRSCLRLPRPKATPIRCIYTNLKQPTLFPPKVFFGCSPQWKKIVAEYIKDCKIDNKEDVGLKILLDKLITITTSQIQKVNSGKQEILESILKQLKARRSLNEKNETEKNESSDKPKIAINKKSTSNSPTLCSFFRNNGGGKSAAIHDISETYFQISPASV